MSTYTKSDPLQGSFPFEAGQINDQTAGFTGYATTWDVNTRNQRFEPTAFNRTLQEAKSLKKARGGELLYVLLWQHEEPIGGIYSAEPDENGLLVHGFIDLSTKQGARALSGLVKGYLHSLSICFKVRKCRREAGAEVVEDADLYEVSVVTFPGNAQAKMLSVKPASVAWLEALTRDMALVAARHRAREKESAKMTNRSIDNSAMFGVSPDEQRLTIDPRADYASRQDFERELRAQRREEDDTLGLLTPGSKQYQREVQKRLATKF